MMLQSVFQKMGVWPSAVVDFQALVGDSVDNIAGVRGSEVNPLLRLSIGLMIWTLCFHDCMRSLE